MGRRCGRFPTQQTILYQNTRSLSSHSKSSTDGRWAYGFGICSRDCADDSSSSNSAARSGLILGDGLGLLCIAVMVVVVLPGFNLAAAGEVRAPVLYAS